MRILTGDLRGQSVLFRPRPGLRPTSDKVRKAILDSFQSAGIEGMRVLDLFAGTGAVGMEFLSCGALSVTFVDADPKQAAVLKKNLEGLGLKERSVVWVADALEALCALEKSQEPFEIIFLDPPYGRGLVEKVLESLSRSRVLRSGGWIVAESDKRDPKLPVPAGLRRLQEKVYGDTRVDIFVRD